MLPRRISGATYRRFLCSVIRRGGGTNGNKGDGEDGGSAPSLPPPPRCFIDAHNPGVDPENKLLRLQRVAAEFESAAGLHVAAASAGEQSPHSPHSPLRTPARTPRSHTG